MSSLFGLIHLSLEAFRAMPRGHRLYHLDGHLLGAPELIGRLPRLGTPGEMLRRELNM